MLLSLSEGSGVVFWASALPESCLALPIWLLCVLLCFCLVLFLLLFQEHSSADGASLPSVWDSLSNPPPPFPLFPNGTVGNEQGLADSSVSQRHLPWVMGTHVVLDFQATNLLELPVLGELLV